MSDEFASVPFNQRVVFVPHCMRNSEKCKAKEAGSYYLCAECNQCKVADISRKTRELGYQGLYLLKGGRTIEKIFSEAKPRAVVGIACFYEGKQGIEEAEKNGAAVQCVPLTRDGCANTDVDIEDVLSVLEKKS